MTEQERTRCETFWNARIAKLNYNFLTNYLKFRNKNITGVQIEWLQTTHENIEWARQRRNDLTKNRGEW